MSRAARHVVLGLLVAGHLAIGPAVIALGSYQSLFEAAFDVGLLFGQVSLLAIWVAVGRGRFLVRFAVSLGLVAVVWNCLALHTQQSRQLGAGGAG